MTMAGINQMLIPQEDLLEGVECVTKCKDRPDLSRHNNGQRSLFILLTSMRLGNKKGGEGVIVQPGFLK